MYQQGNLVPLCRLGYVGPGMSALKTHLDEAAGQNKHDMFWKVYNALDTKREIHDLLKSAYLRSKDAIELKNMVDIVEHVSVESIDDRLALKITGVTPTPIYIGTGKEKPSLTKFSPDVFLFHLPRDIDNIDVFLNPEIMGPAGSRSLSSFYYSNRIIFVNEEGYENIRNLASKDGFELGPYEKVKNQLSIHRLSFADEFFRKSCNYVCQKIVKPLIRKL